MRISDWSSDVCSSDLPVAVLFQDFQVRCRMHRLTSPACDLPEFRRRLAMAKAGFFDRDDARLPPVLAIAGELPEDMLAPFLLIAHAALRSEEHTSELQSLMRISSAVFCLKKKNTIH